MWQFGAVEIEDEEYDGNIYYSDYSVKNDDNTGETIRTDDSSSNSINVYYQTKLAAGRWLPVVKNNEDYAGIRGQNITGLAVTTDTGYIKYRVHVGSGWLDFIDSRNTDINDYYNGYAGNDTPVDAVEIYYYTPDDIIKSSGYHYAFYRVSPVNGNYYSYQKDNNKDNGMDGYAGIWGHFIDRLQIDIR